MSFKEIHNLGQCIVQENSYPQNDELYLPHPDQSSQLFLRFVLYPWAALNAEDASLKDLHEFPSNVPV